jgi:hypothetical protein
MILDEKYHPDLPDLEKQTKVVRFLLEVPAGSQQ